MVLGEVAVLLNGVFGDPLVCARFLHEKRCLLFDLGDLSRLQARLLHQVTDVFVSHAHMDHIIGFLPLVRMRIGELPPCRVFGPPGMARRIAEELTLIVPGEKLVYATDLADTVENRRRLVSLAENADAFFCEASFLEADRAQADRTGHLTARACAEIAAAAKVKRLVPFHFFEAL